MPAAPPPPILFAKIAIGRRQGWWCVLPCVPGDQQPEASKASRLVSSRGWLAAEAMGRFTRESGREPYRSGQ